MSLGVYLYVILLQWVYSFMCEMHLSAFFWALQYLVFLFSLGHMYEES